MAFTFRNPTTCNPEELAILSLSCKSKTNASQRERGGTLQETRSRALLRVDGEKKNTQLHKKALMSTEESSSG